MAPDSPWRWAAFLALNALAIFNVVQAMRLWFPVSDRAAAWARGFLLWCGQVILLQLVLGLVGLLRLWALTAAVAGLALTLGWLGRRRQPQTAATLPGEESDSDSTSDWAPRVAVGLALGFGLYWLWLLALTPPLGTDSLTYHLPFVAQWHQTGRLERDFSTHFIALPYTPFYADLVYHWLFAPVGTDILCRFGQLPFLVFSAVSLHNILRLLGVPGGSARAAAAAMALSRPFFPIQLALQNVDVQLAWFGLAAVEEALRLRRTGRWAETVMHALAVGLMLGTKHSGVPLAPAILGLGWLLAPPRVGRTPRAAAALAATGLAIAFGGYVYADNLARAGSPFFPAGLRLFGVEFFRGLTDPQHWDYGPAHSGAFATLVSLEDSFTFTPNAAVVALGAAAAGLWIWRTRERDRVDDWLVPTVLGAVPIALCAVIFALVPLRQSRYMLLPVALFLGWFAVALEGLRHRPLLRTVAAAGFVVLQYLDPDLLGEIPDPAFLWIPALLGTAFAGLGWLATRAGAARLAGARAWGTAACLLAVCGAAAWGPTVRAYLAERRANYRANPSLQGLGGASSVLARLTHGRPTTIACAGTSEIYPLQGETLDNRVVYVHVQADARRWIHEYGASFAHLPSYGFTEFQTLFRSRPDLAAWRRNLEREACEFVLVAADETHLLSARTELEWMTNDPGRFEPLFADHEVYLFRVRPGP